VNNSYFFKDLSNILLNWELVEDGKVIQNGAVSNLNIDARQAQMLSLPFKTNYATGKEYFLNVHYRLKTPEPFLEKGYEIAYEQMALAGAKASVYTGNKKALKVEQTADKAVVKGSDFTITFDLTKGTLTSYISKGKELLASGPQPGFYRAPTDNDIGAGLNTKLRIWRNVYQNNDATNIKSTVNSAADGFTLTVKSSLLKGDAATTQQFTVLADGTVKVDNQFKAITGNYKSLMRIGNDLQLKSDYINIQWYGRGPGENYVDRKTASLIGNYKSTLADQYFPYARPQESGNKTDVRWVTFTNKEGKGLRFEFADHLLSFNALPYSLEDLDPEAEKKQYHSGELVKRNQIYVHMDLLQLGVQGIDSWGAMPLIQHQIPFKDYQYSYYIKTIK